MRLVPGGALWLLRHELRMAWFRMGGASKGAARRGPRKPALFFMAATLIAVHFFAWTLLHSVGTADKVALAMPLTLLYAVAFSLMLSMGLGGCIEALFERGDLDLLLSSPLPTRSVFTARLGGVVLKTAGLYLLLVGPFANVGLLLGRPQWLALYPVVLGTAAVASSLAMLSTLALVRLIGIRRARVLAQVLGALAGAFFFLLSQFYANTMNGASRAMSSWLMEQLASDGHFGVDSLLWLPGRAILGAPLPLLGLAAVGAAAFLLTVHFTHRFFVHGLQQAVSIVRNPAAPAAGVRYRFDRSLAASVMLKEWRMIARDPQLISQVLLQLLYLLPMCFMLVFRTRFSIPGLGASLVFLCTSLTTSLAWLIIAAEDAPDLLRAAPASALAIARAKLAAAALPALAILALPLLWLAWRSPLPALLLAACAAGATVTAAMIVQWCARPAARGDFRTRGKGNYLSTFFEFTTALAWTGLVWLVLSRSGDRELDLLILVGAGVLCVVLLGLIGAAFSMRQRPA